jgi:hypothetical protein
MYQMPYRNPHASAALILPVLVLCNTDTKDLESNIVTNSARDLPWIGFHVEHKGNVVLCGGGPSIADHLDDIRALQQQGSQVYAMNATSQFLRSHGIEPDVQVIADAKPETVSLYDPQTAMHFLASQVDPEMFEQGGDIRVWHLAIDEEMDRLFPAARKKAGGYALVGGGASVGNSALCLSYVLGYRSFDLFGYDSSHREEASHAYDQPMNRFIPTVDVHWGGKTYTASVAMKAQAEKFQISAQQLKREGCDVRVHGTGLLPAMWNTDPSNLTERDKYRLLWATDTYRDFSPAEQLTPLMLELLKPDSLVLDFGCGTARASLALHKAGVDVLLIDFADNCRDEEAMGLPFLEWDLTLPMPPSAKYGICCDVMEHIKPEDVATVINNITQSAAKVFFNISTVPDHCGALIHDDLHLTVRPHAWWKTLLSQYGSVCWEREDDNQSLFVLQRAEA